MRKLILDMSRPAGRLFYCLISVLLAVSLLRGAPPPTPPATTAISDVIYRADGSPAAGTLLITWPAFTTADNRAVPAGSMSLAIGPFGAISLALVPNQGATPPGTYYKVVYKLNDGTTSQEFWVVPTLSPTTISAIRSQVVPAGVALQVVSRQYVDGAIAAANANLNNLYVLKSGDTMTGLLTLSGNPTQSLHASTKSYVDTQVGTRALDSAVVHLASAETITGVKAFSASPTVPTPATDTAAANKAYVDSVAAGSGNGVFVLKAGDTMTGALILSGDPTLAGQASNKNYVDTQVGPRALDSAVAHLTGNEAVGGIKQFSSSPTVPTPAGAADASNKSYVDTQVGTRALDSAVVHLAGAETVTGAKAFSVSPTVPTPATDTAAANKAYVDSVATGGSGAFVLKAGDTMTGALTLSGDPTLSGHAANKNYVDSQVGTRALDSSVVHLAGNETIAGTKQFSSPPAVPTPIAGTDAANKAYVDGVGGGGSGGVGGAFLNAITDCGATGNGSTDDSTAIQACINANPHKTIVFPKRRSCGLCTDSYASQTAASTDYYFSQRLQLKGYSTALVCENGGEVFDEGGGCVFKFAATATGGIYIDNTCDGCKVQGIGFYGQHLFQSPSYTTFQPGLTDDGIYITGGHVLLDRVASNFWGRHGIQVDGTQALDGGLADEWDFRKVTALDNQQDGIYLHGSDSNQGACWLCNGFGNGHVGIRDNSLLGNVWIAPHTNGNGRQITDPATVVVSAAVRVSNVVTITTATSITSGPPVAGNAMKVAGVSDSSFNGTFLICGPPTAGCAAPTATSFTFQQTAANASSSGGTARFADLQEISTTFWDGFIGAYYSTTASTWVQPYAELNQGGTVDCIDWQGGMVIQPNVGCDIRSDSGSTPYVSSGAGSYTVDGLSTFQLHNRLDSPLNLNFISGKTANQATQFNFMDRVGGGGHVLWQMVADPGAFQLNDSANSGLNRLNVLPNGDTYLNAGAGSHMVTVNWLGAGTAGMRVCSGGNSLSCNLQIDGTGQIISSLATGTAPLSVASTTPVANLTLSADSQLPTISTAGKVADTALSSNVALKNQANTYSAGSKQTFQNSASTAGLNLTSSADPSAPAQGDVWINASDLKFRGASATQTAERQANKGAASGYAALDANSAIVAPATTGTAPLSVSSTTPVANLTLSADSQLPTLSSAGKVADSALSSNIPRLNQANSFAAGQKQTFQNSASTAGLNLTSSADPSAPAQGDVWINSSDLKFRGASATQTAERQANKGTANGYASLDGSTLVPSAQLPNPAASTKGGVQSKDCSASGMIQKINTDSTVSCSTTLTSTSVATVSANTTSDQNLMSLSLPAGALNTAGRFLSISGAGVYSTAASQTPTLTFKIKLCTISGCGSGTVLTLASWTTAATTASASNIPWRVSLALGTVSTGATGTVEGHGSSTVTLGTTAGAAAEVRNDTVTAASSAIDLTAALFLQFTVATSTSSASNSIAQRQGLASAVN